jgi:hypothetical protein
MNSKLFISGLFFVFIFLSGFWLSRTGKPYNMLLITFHKLVSLAGGVYLGRMVYRLHRRDPLSPVQIAAVVVTILFFIVNVTTGSLLSADKPMPEIVSTLNKYFPYLTVIATAVMICLLVR